MEIGLRALAPLLITTTLFHITLCGKQDCTDLVRDEETLLVFSTLGGGLTAVDPRTSEIRWIVDDEPAVKAGAKLDHHTPYYLPDPRDGSLYQLGDMGNLKKLPFTIPELVANAPCRSSDGILYSGKKSDTWFLINPKTGQRVPIMGFESSENRDDSIGWATSRPIYLGRTQYTVIMYDSLSKTKNTKPWNITFYDYSSHTMAPEISSDYEYIHLTGSSSGLIVTLNRKTGKYVWQNDLKSPIIAAFLLAAEGLLSVPFTTVSDGVLRNIIDNSKEGNPSNIELFRSLYIGEYPFGLYALSSLIDKNTATISSGSPIKLIEGPQNLHTDQKQNLIYFDDLLKKQKNAVVMGHYQLPKKDDEYKITTLPTIKSVDAYQLTTIRNVGFARQKNGFILVGGILQHTNAHPEKVDVNILTNNTETHFTDKASRATTLPLKFFLMVKEWLTDKQTGTMHQILIALILVITCLFCYIFNIIRELRQHSQSGSQCSNRNSAMCISECNELINVGNGEVKIGKIQFNCNDILGKGCEGTFVFKGTFEKRKVAVKRVLPECFTFADREVSLLRESDAHENVVRYFCTEQDRQFRYIAVELCAATLQDYTEGELSTVLQMQVSAFKVLQQATKGLAHLHSLNIVHRDIKPQNVLISLPNANNQVRAMISDFGLCKKLNYGKASFSRRSGITGTDGWIAPEMIKGQRTTTSVDIFSLGCVYYYVLTKGHHAFGEPLKRQANILSHEYDLSKLATDELRSCQVLAAGLISDMINFNSQNRPSAKAVIEHPFFWCEEKTLSFFQDVSDRVEKIAYLDEPLKSLEKNAKFIVKNNWTIHLESVITADLRKYRGYSGISVRDLLRALRNKKHHYHELSYEAQNILGNISSDFTKYWTDKFPHLLSHAYHALSICSNEAQFISYYSNEYTFSRPYYFSGEYDKVETSEYTKPTKTDCSKKNYQQKKKAHLSLHIKHHKENEFEVQYPFANVFRSSKYRSNKFKSKVSPPQQDAVWRLPDIIKN